MTDQEDVAQLFAECCARESNALIVCHEPATVRHATFIASGRDTVTLEVFVEKAEMLPLQPLSICTVSFHHSNRVRTFPGRVREYDAFGEQRPTMRLVLAHPRQIAGDDARLSFRVPVLEGTEVKVRVRAGNAPVRRVRPLNVSMTGIFFKLAEVTDELRPGTAVEVELQFGGHTVALSGIVRRRDPKQGYGVLFPETLQGHDVNPPEPLRRIVKELERLWLRRRVG